MTKVDMLVEALKQLRESNRLLEMAGEKLTELERSLLEMQEAKKPKESKEAS